MKIIIQFIVLQWFINISFAQTPTNHKVALVIGNTEYIGSSKLKNAENDANAMIAFLKSRGFDVISGVNLTRSEMNKRIFEFGEQLKEGGIHFFFFSGHGLEKDGRNYLCPIEDKADYYLKPLEQLVDLDKILYLLKDKKSCLNTLWIDACRTPPAPEIASKLGGGATKGFKPTSITVNANNETIISFAATSGQPSWEGDGNSSPYTEAVLTALKTPCLQIMDYYAIIGNLVKSKTAGNQTPSFSGSITTPCASAFSFTTCEGWQRDIKYGIEKYENKDSCEGFKWLRLHENTFSAYKDPDLTTKTAYYLGCTYESGLCTPKNFQKAVQYYEMAAQRNYLEAQYRLGCVYKSLQNAVQARSWFSMAAQSGHAAAQFELGSLLEQERNNARAAEWYEKAAQQNHLEATYRLGILYDNGVTRMSRGLVLIVGTDSYLRDYRTRTGTEETVLERDIPKAVSYYRKAAEGGHALAQFTMGTIYENGEKAARIAADSISCFKWYQKAALQNEPRAQNALGNLYFDGRGVQKNDNQAFIWYEKSANQGNREAQNHVGQLYFEGKGVSQSDSEAFKWFQKAAEKNLAEAQYNMGMLQLAGRGVPRNGTLAVEWIQKAALQEYVNAEYYLGVLYFQGTGVIQNEDSATYWLQKAAKKKFDLAQFYLAKRYQKQGRDSDVFKSFKQVFDSQQVIPNAQRIEAQYEMALMYLAGKGISKDENKAANWLRDAADANYAKAQTALGDLYERGIGVPRKNLEQACKYYHLAAQQNEPVAVQKLKTMKCNP